MYVSLKYQAPSIYLLTIKRLLDSPTGGHYQTTKHQNDTLKQHV